MVRDLHAVVFDLDGTLVDSYGAIAECFNHARTALGEPPLDEDQIRRMVGHGLESLMEASVGPERAPRGVELFRERYDRICEARTVALPEVGDTLRRLRAAGLRLAVATNKPPGFARRILAALELAPLLESEQARIWFPSSPIDPRGTALGKRGFPRPAGSAQSW